MPEPTARKPEADRTPEASVQARPQRAPWPRPVPGLSGVVRLRRGGRLRCHFDRSSSVSSTSCRIAVVYSSRRRHRQRPIAVRRASAPRGDRSRAVLVTRRTWSHARKAYDGARSMVVSKDWFSRELRFCGNVVFSSAPSCAGFATTTSWRVFAGSQAASNCAERGAGRVDPRHAG